MSGNEVQGLKEDVTEIKSDVKEIFTMLNDVRISLAGDYVTRKDLKEHEDKERTSRRWWAGFTLAVASLLAAVVRNIKL